jgi:replicative DNA helicase
MYITLENNSIMTMDRLLSMRLGINSKEFYNHDGFGIEQTIIDKVEKEREVLNDNTKFFMVETLNLSIDDVENLIIEAKQRFKEDYLVVTIDLLTMLNDFSNKVDAQEYEAKINKLFTIINRQNIHLVAVVQANTEGLRGVKINKMDDLDKLVLNNGNCIKNSRAFYERARVVISLFRKKHYANYYFPDLEEAKLMDDTMEVHIIKQNFYKLGKLEYLFNYKTYQFEKYENKIKKDINIKDTEY